MNASSMRLTKLAIICASIAAIPSAFAGTVLSLSQKPLYGAIDLAPNFFVTLDDSGSMASAYMPDTLTFGTTSRRFRAADANPMAYDPSILYEAPKKNDGTTYSTSFTKAYINGFNPSQGDVDLSTAYKATVTYTPGGSNSVANHPSVDFPSPTNSAGAAAYYYKRVLPPATLPTGCGSPTHDDDRCFVKVPVTNLSGTGPAGLDERQNFANWYSFYRTRNLMMMSGASLAFFDLSPKIRVTWQAINSCKGFGGSCNSSYQGTAVDNKLRTFTDGSDGDQRKNFYTWLSRIPASGGTPLRTAYAKVAAALSTTGANSPYGEFPNRTLPAGVSSQTEYSCRSNYALLLTDGLWNNDTSTATGLSSPGSPDSVSTRSLPADKDGNIAVYTSRPPYAGATAYTLADMAFEYWARDFRTGSTISDKNDVPKYMIDATGTADDQYWNPKNDPATWQHLVTFTVGLGLGKTLASTGPVWAGDTYAGGYASVLAGAAWPAPSDNSSNNVSDLWHAALNSRGQFFSADKPQSLVNAFLKIISRVQAGSGSASVVSANSTQLSTGTAIFQAKFTGKGWAGDLLKLPISAGGVVGSPVWSAANMLASPDPATRVVISSNGTSGIPFRWSNLTTAQQTQLQGSDTAALAQKRLDWIRGDATNEGAKSTDLRQRPLTKLGDIVNSSPQFVGTPDTGSLDSTYSDFILSNCSASSTYCTDTRAPVVYVGANDGMLHGFKESDGSEVLAFIPSAVFPNLRDLSYQGYDHKMYVDGTPRVADAYVSGAWRTMLVGGLGAGGRGVYALNVTDPDNFTEANASGGANRIVQWELTGGVDPDVGFIYGRPQIVKTNNGKWAAIFGNGYNNSGTGKSALFIVFLDAAESGGINGAGSYMKLGTSTGSGLSTVFPADVNADGVVDYVFAGDVDGQLWKFDLTDSSSGNWVVANSGQPLFIAKDGSNNPLAITSMPQVAKHPRGGMMVLFGTGSTLQVSDMTNTQVNRFYGIWDTTDYTPRPVPLSMLESRSFAVSGNYRTISGPSFNWYKSGDPSSKLGWYVELSDSKERLSGDPVVSRGRLIFASSVPNTTDPCDIGGYTWLTEIDLLTGLSMGVSPFDVDGNGIIDSADLISAVPAASKKLTVGASAGPGALIKDGGTSSAERCSTGSSGAVSCEKENLFGRNPRLNWREIAE